MTMTPDDALERATQYLRQEGASTPAMLQAFVFAVYNDGWRDMRDLAVKAATAVEANAANKRVTSESGLSVEQGRRLAASEIAMKIGAINVVKEIEEKTRGKRDGI